MRDREGVSAYHLTVLCDRPLLATTVGARDALRDTSRGRTGPQETTPQMKFCTWEGEVGLVQVRLL
jgi:hypothetical protein